MNQQGNEGREKGERKELGERRQLPAEAGLLHLTDLELMRYCAIPTASGVPVIVTSLSPPSPSFPAIFIWAPLLTLRQERSSREEHGMDRKRVVKRYKERTMANLIS